MTRTQTSIVLATALALLAPISAGAQGAPPEGSAALQGPAVSARVLGTVLQVEPGAGYEQAVLRVAGPRGYALGKRFAGGGPLEADLLAEAEGRARDRPAAAAERAGPREGRPGPVPWTALPDGGYVWEVVLSGTGGESRTHVGRFRVDNGVATLPVRGRSEPARAGGSSVPDGRLAEKAVTELDFIKIADGGNDGTTFLTLGSDNESGSPLESWGVFNRFGHFTIEECGDGSSLGSCQKVLLALLDDQTSTTRMGIGTAAPAAADLHIVSPDGRIRIEATQASTWEIQEIGGGLEFVLLSPSPFWPSDPIGSKLFISGSGAVGVGVSDPDATLHVGGSAIVEGDVALGSSRTIKHAVEPVEPGEVLSAIRELPLYSWKYRADPVQALHLGPMAEDVHAAFALGRDDKHLSPGDSAGLALAAVQGVDAELGRLRDELTRRIAELERLLVAANAAGERPPECPVQERAGTTRNVRPPGTR